MKTDNKRLKIWTIGHSNRTFEEFTALLNQCSIEYLIDVRRFPGSRKHPHFNKENLEVNLPHEKIEYKHIDELGGRRKVRKDSTNTAWRNESFQGYADYMETAEFMDGINKLKKIAKANRTAIMCSEAVWWRCHRSLISDWLKCDQWEVLHILGKNQVKEHPYTKPATVINGHLAY